MTPELLGGSSSPESVSPEVTPRALTHTSKLKIFGLRSEKRRTMRSSYTTASNLLLPPGSALPSASHHETPLPPRRSSSKNGKQSGTWNWRLQGGGTPFLCGTYVSFCMGPRTQMCKI